MAKVRPVGRPRVYNGTQRRIIAGVIKKHGLTGALTVLKDRGIPASMTVVRAVAKDHGITLQRGRPRKVA